jgi:hypothetical protein
LPHWGSRGGCTCCLDEGYQVLVVVAVAVVAAEVVVAELVLVDRWGNLHLLIQGPQEVDLIPNVGQCEVGSCDAMEAPATISIN